MLQKDKFQPLIVGLPNFQVIGRIEIEQGDRLGRAADVHDVRVQDFDAEFFGLLCSVGVNLDPISTGWRFSEHVCKRHSVSNAGVNRREFALEDQQPSETNRLSDREWEET